MKGQQKRSVIGNIALMFSHIDMNYFQPLQIALLLSIISMALNIRGMEYPFIIKGKTNISGIGQFSNCLCTYILFG